MAVLSRNIHRIGDLLQQQEQRHEKRRRKRAECTNAFKLAA
jgi:hypothetical protein